MEFLPEEIDQYVQNHTQKESPLLAELNRETYLKGFEIDKNKFEKLQKLIQDIVDNENSVGGKPNERLDWVPEQYRENETFENLNYIFNTNGTLVPNFPILFNNTALTSFKKLF